MLDFKTIVIGAGLSCMLFNAPILVHADIVEIKTFKNNVQGGAAATDIKITSNRHPFKAISDRFDISEINGNDIQLRGGSLAQGASTTVTITYDGNAKVVKESASFSFLGSPDVPITTPMVGEFGGQIPVNGGFTGFLELTNEGDSTLVFSNFVAAVNVPAVFFSDLDSDAALALLTANNLFISQGTPVPVPSDFSLAAGEGRRFDLGPMTGTNYISSFFDVFFELTPSDTTRFGVAVQGIVPEPSALLLLASGLSLLALAKCRTKRR
jgi:hypothetical protein